MYQEALRFFYVENQADPIQFLNQNFSMVFNHSSLNPLSPNSSLPFQFHHHFFQKGKINQPPFKFCKSFRTFFRSFPNRIEPIKIPNFNSFSFLFPSNYIPFRDIIFLSKSTQNLSHFRKKSRKRRERNYFIVKNGRQKKAGRILGREGIGREWMEKGEGT